MSDESAVGVVDTAARQVAETLEGRLDSLVDEWVERMWQDPDFAEFARDELREPARQNARADIGRELTAMVDDELPLSCPDEVSASARMAALTGFPLAGVTQSYRTGHAVQWNAWHDAVEELGLTGAQRRAVLDRGSEFLFQYADRCCKWAEREYTLARERLLRGKEQLRTQAVRDLLASREAEIENLGYALEADHLAVIASGENAEEALEGLATALDGRLLRVAVDQGSWWGWLGFDDWDSDLPRRLAQWNAPPGTRVAVGGPASGVDGFRRAHDEAQQASRVGERQPDRVALYEDVALVALAAQDQRRAQDFVDHELGPIAGTDERSVALRQTLRAYLGTGQNASSAAALLGVHERTVANRLRAMEEQLGHAVATRSSELDTALRLEQLLAEPTEDS